jgi:hypothetical protein
MSAPPGFVVRGCQRAFLAAGDSDVTAAELFKWCYPRRRGGSFLDRRNSYRAIRKAAGKMAVKVGRMWPHGNVWRLRNSGDTCE